jgi:hypothetical protein
MHRGDATIAFAPDSPSPVMRHDVLIFSHG